MERDIHVHMVESGYNIYLANILDTVQDDLLAGVIFGGFACGKKLADFILAILCHVPLSMLRLKQNGGFYIGDFFKKRQMPILIPRQ